MYDDGFQKAYLIYSVADSQNDVFHLPIHA